MKNNDFVQIYRDLFDHPYIVKCSGAYRSVLLTVLLKACHAPCQMNDHGTIINLLPGQYLGTIRGIAELSGVSKKEAENALRGFVSNKILGLSRGQRKTVYTVLWGIKLNTNGTNFGTSGGQVGDIKEERKNERSSRFFRRCEREEAGAALADFDSLSKKYAEYQENNPGLVEKCEEAESKMPTKKDVLQWIDQGFSEGEIMNALGKSFKKVPKSIPKYMQTILGKKRQL